MTTHAHCGDCHVHVPVTVASLSATSLSSCMLFVADRLVADAAVLLRKARRASLVDVTDVLLPDVDGICRCCCMAA